MKKKDSVQEWLPFDEIIEEGIIKLKNEKYIKIAKIIPINYELKSDLEKEAILNSYKIFLKTCDFNIQILIQSKKENLNNHILKLEEEKENNKKLNDIYNNYIEYIKKINIENKSSSKNFYIIFDFFNPDLNSKLISEKENYEKIVKNNLKEKFFKIKECLSRCGNFVIDVNEYEEIKDVLFSFFNCRKKIKE